VIIPAVTLGLRPGELLGLSWRHIDLAARRPTVAGTASRTLAARPSSPYRRRPRGHGR
jgi:integrase